MKNTLKRKLKQGKVGLGTVVTIDSPTVAEILTKVGFDWLWFDLEHGPLSIETTQSHLQALNGSDVTPLIRVPWNDHVFIKSILDIGPHGLVIPLINTKEEAEAAVRAMKYPPVGVRGAGLARAQGYGADMDEYIKSADREVMVILQIEHIDAVNNVEEILTVKGVDTLFIGPLDLSGSMGLLGQMSHPDVEAAIQKVLKACKKARVPAGIFTATPEQANERIKQGFQFIAMGVDVCYLLNAAKEAAERIERRKTEKSGRVRKST